MATITTGEHFLEIVRKSSLIEQPRLDTCLAEANGKGQLPTDPKQLAQLLIRTGLLTPFQAGQLLQGKWRNFILTGKYKLLDVLGSGGMGQVFLCEHILMQRKVALKVMPSDRTKNPSDVQRFLREAQALASLHHPNIVQAYDVDRSDKLLYLVMEYVEGYSLHELVKEKGPLEVGRAAGYIAQAAAGLQHAHEAGWVHRDIKPGNLLVDQTGTVKILDLGLACLLGDDTPSPTMEYEEKTILGTADYLSPEQAVSSHDVDIRADIYSLGATFYFLLTGQAPFPTGSVAQKLIWHQMRDPQPVRELRPEVPEGMVAVLGKMMAKDPKQRYQQPWDVVGALQSFCQLDPVPLSSTELGSALRRLSHDGSHPSVNLPSTSGIVPTAPPTGAIQPEPAPDLPGQQEARVDTASLSASETAEEERAPRHVAKKKSGHPIVIVVASAAILLAGIAITYALITMSGKSDQPGTPTSPVALGGPQPGKTSPSSPATTQRVTPTQRQPATGRDPVKPPVVPNPQIVVKHWPTPFQDDPGKPGEMWRTAAHGAPVEALLFLSKGTRLLSAGHDKTIRLWDLETHHELKKYEGHTNSIRGLALTPDEKYFLSASYDGTARLWEIESGKQVRTFNGHKGEVTCVACSPDGQSVLTGGGDGTVRLWELATGKPVREMSKAADRVTAVLFTADGQQAVSATMAKKVDFWDIGSGEHLRQLEVPDIVWRMGTSPDGSWLLLPTGSQLRQWSLPSARYGPLIETKQTRLSGGSYTPSGRHVLAVGMDKAVCVYDRESGKQVVSLTGHEEHVWCVLPSPGGRYAATSSKDSTVRLWRLPDEVAGGYVGEVMRIVEAHPREVENAAYTPDGKRLLSTSMDKDMRCWEAKTGKLLKEYQGHSQALRGLVILPDGRRAVTTSKDNSLRLWDIDSGRQLVRYDGHTRSAQAVALSPNGRQLISASEDSTLRLWELETGNCLKVLKGHTSGVQAVVFSADGTKAISGGSDKTLRVWDLDKGTTVKKLEQPFVIWRMAHSPDGPWVAYGSEGSLRMWNYVTEEAPRVFSTLNKSNVDGTCFTRDGRYVIGSGFDNVIRVWNVATGQLVLYFYGHPKQPLGLALSPDGKVLVSCGRDKILCFWQLPEHMTRALVH